MEDRRNITVVSPANDGESKTIVDICKRLGVDVRVSDQSWGATLDAEPPGNLRDLKEIVVIVEMPSPELEDNLRTAGHKLYVVDHHDYRKLGLDRRKPESSLEQVAEILRYELSRWELGIAINDRSYIYGLMDAGYTTTEILDIRRYDLQHQGISSEDIASVKTALESAPIERGITILHMDRPVGGYAQDFLVLKSPDKVPDLLVLTGTPVNRARFYGDPRKIRLLEDIGEWSGGSGRSGFWGTDHPDLEKIFDRLGLQKPKSVQRLNDLICGSDLS